MKQINKDKILETTKNQALIKAIKDKSKALSGQKVVEK
jgi:hypothetical protein